MSYADIEYEKLCKLVLDTGKPRTDRTGTGTLSVFGTQSRYDLTKGFPLLTTTKVHFKSVVVELLWMLKGDTNIKFLNDHGVTIWDEWADKDGHLGPVYGAQWRWWITSDEWGETTDQIAQVIESIKTDPYGRRHIVTAWNPGDLEHMALPPCHMTFQFYVSESQLSCHMYQRSADIFLGVPFNIASYALLTHLIAQVCNLGVGELVHSIGDAHIYNNHVAQVMTQMGRAGRYAPGLVVEGDRIDIDSFEVGDISLIGYDPHPAIKGEVSV